MSTLFMSYICTEDLYVKKALFQKRPKVGVPHRPFPARAEHMPLCRQLTTRPRCQRRRGRSQPNPVLYIYYHSSSLYIMMDRTRGHPHNPAPPPPSCRVICSTYRNLTPTCPPKKKTQTSDNSKSARKPCCRCCRAKGKGTFYIIKKFFFLT